jgi:hypothetical protein
MARIVGSARHARPCSGGRSPLLDEQPVGLGALFTFAVNGGFLQTHTTQIGCGLAPAIVGHLDVNVIA